MNTVVENGLVTQSIPPEKRVALILASLEPDVAARVMQELDPMVMTKAAESIRNLGIVPGPVLNNAVNESLVELQGYTNSIQGNASLAVGLLSKVVGEQQATSMLEIGQAGGNRFGALASRSAEDIARMLSAESASIVSLVLRFLPSKLASDTLELMDEVIRRKVVLQMATSELPPEHIIEQVEQQMVSRLPLAGKRTLDGDARIDAVVSIMQRASKEAADAMIEDLAKEDPDLADRVRDQMFVFEDFVNLDDDAVRRIMQELENGVLSVALRKASDKVKDRFFSNMSKRASEGLLEEMSFAGKMPSSEVLAKQKIVVQLARSLAGKGEISISSQEDEYV